MKKKIIGLSSLLAIFLMAIVACTKEPTSDPVYPGGGSGGSGGGGGSSVSSAPKPPTGVRAERYGSWIKVSWNSVSDAYMYKLYRSSGSSHASSDGPYTWIYSTTATYCYDESPDHINYYRVTTVDWDGVESEMSSYTGYTF